MYRRPEDLRKTFRVVCLCGSAGALEAYQAILRSLPPDSGMAFVVVAHRAKQNTSLLRLLAYSTRMPVIEIEEGTHIEPDCVFVMPPHVHMTVTNEAFHLAPCPAVRPGWPTSISAFLSSLAASVGPRAIAVILSGMAYDGSAALSVVKEGGGMTFAQSGADFESMPQHAIDTGHVDFILSAADIGAFLSTMSPSGG